MCVHLIVILNLLSAGLPQVFRRASHGSDCQLCDSSLGSREDRQRHSARHPPLCSHRLPCWYHTRVQTYLYTSVKLALFNSCRYQSQLYIIHDSWILNASFWKSTPHILILFFATFKMFLHSCAHDIFYLFITRTFFALIVILSVTIPFCVLGHYKTISSQQKFPISCSDISDWDSFVQSKRRWRGGKVSPSCLWKQLLPWRLSTQLHWTLLHTVSKSMWNVCLSIRGMCPSKDPAYPVSMGWGLGRTWKRKWLWTCLAFSFIPGLTLVYHLAIVTGLNISDWNEQNINI